MATREEELSKLYEIKELLDRKKKLNDRTEQLRKEYGRYISEADSVKYERLPTDNEHMAKWEYDEVRDRLKKRSKEIAKGTLWLIGIPVGLGIWILLLEWYRMYYHFSLEEIGSWDTEKWLTGVIFVALIGFIVFLIIRLLIRALSTYISKHTSSKKVESERISAIRAAEEIDKRNEKENQRRHEEAKKLAREKVQGKLDAIDQERSRINDEMRQIDKSIEEIHLLSKDDIQCVDYLIERISSRRADSLKEALRDLDMHREKSKKEFDAWLKDFNAQCDRDRQRREQERREEEQFWSDMRERERRREHEKKVEDELQRMRQMLEDD